MPPALLDTLLPGQHATILAVEADQGLHQRLGALGFRIGKRVELIRRAAFNGPLHVRIGSTDVILRRAQARCILVTPVAGAA